MLEELKNLLGPEWEIMIKEQKERFKFTPEQWYMIIKIAECLDE